MKYAGSFLVFVSACFIITNTSAQEKPKLSCQTMVESFCDTLWAAPHHGNYDIKDGKTNYQLRFGVKNNDVSNIRYEFLQSLYKNFSTLPADMQQVFNKIKLKQTLHNYINRKDIKTLNIEDMYAVPFFRGSISDLENAMHLVATIRTQKKIPGYIRMKADEESSEVNNIYYRNLDMAWSELFVAVWKNHPRWKKVKEIFALVRDEYINLVKNDKSTSEALKKAAIEDLMTVKLVIPGESPTKSNSRQWHTCGIDMTNAVYSPNNHDITICAGEFIGGEALLTLAHEMGHSFSLLRRIQSYLRQSAYGKDIMNLHQLSCEKKHFSCKEWTQFKNNFDSNVSSLPNYTYDDDKFLANFIQNDLLPIPVGEEMKKLSTRLSKTTVRNTINDRSLEGILKTEEILPNASRVKNFRYLSACLNSARWPNALNTLVSDYTQFELFFAEEYQCQLDKKVSPNEAIKTSIELATDMINKSWTLWMRVPGRYNFFQEARNEEFAKDIEEDVVDSYASRISASILNKMESIEDRRNTYLANVASYCDKPSFRQAYPVEAGVLFKFTNASHSIGQDRRTKLLTPEIRESLQCE
ncbi:hypothetical protein K2P97_06645 [bacterium]|nr:hypothetical protein [bacterium]